MIGFGGVLLFGWLDRCFRCCSGRNGSEYPWNGNDSFGGKSRLFKDLTFQITDVNILERNSSNYGLQETPVSRILGSFSGKRKA